MAGKRKLLIGLVVVAVVISAALILPYVMSETAGQVDGIWP
ncbi:MAG: hypothetical protein ABIJ46_00110 [bacterium]